MARAFPIHTYKININLLCAVLSRCIEARLDDVSLPVYEFSMYLEKRPFLLGI